MKTLKIAGLVALVLMVIALSIRLLSGDEDAWFCQNGQWVKHGNPSALQPTAVCLPTLPTGRQDGQAGGEPDSGSASTTVSQTEIEVFSPLPGQTVEMPFTVTGRARGNWFFEASFPVEVNYKGQVVAQGIAQAKSEWMTTEFVPFEAKVNFLVGIDIAGAIEGRADLILRKDNPSDLRQYDKEISLPILIGFSQTMKVKAFFSNNNLDKEITCVKAFPADRQIAKTVSVARVALEELLKGPSQAELAQGYYTSINSNVKIQKLTIADGTAKVDFDETLETGMGGSCRVSAIRTQITETLKQFPTVKNVIISINGRTEDILQP